jgi:tetratricopeptide (TPR) repeat protein
MPQSGSGPTLNPRATASLHAYRQPAPLPADLNALRNLAHDAYAKGLLAEATDTQSAVLTMALTAGTPTVDDFLFAGLIHHAARRLADGAKVLRDGLNLYPDNPALHENLAVLLLQASDLNGTIEACRSALALGSDSPNVHDCLCEAYQRTRHPDLAVQAGRLALEAKDRRFGASPPLVTVPKTSPPPFDPTRPERNVIAYTLWGNDPRYFAPLLENLRIRPHLFPQWTIRIYHDRTVDPAYLTQLAAHGAQLHPMTLPPGVPAHRALLWRFEAIADPAIQRFLIRDADALLTVKERVAIDAWLRSGFHFHAMRDWYTHTDLLLAGMWGGVAGILPPPATLLLACTFWRMETDHLDQDLLTETVWPVIRHNILINDSIFHPCLGSVPFPPFGALPDGHHIGQNAFVHFTKTG